MPHTTNQPPRETSDTNLVLILGEIKGQLTQLTAVIGSLQGEQRALESRVRTLEHMWAKLLGAAAAAGALAGFIIDVMLK